MKKKFVLGVLFILPLVAYLFFASGVNHFSKLPVLETKIGDITRFSEPSDSISLKNHITILGFMGNNLDVTKGNIFNINQKIYNYFHNFSDFQMLMLMPNGTQNLVAKTMKELDGLTNTHKWKFIYAEPSEIRSFFKTLNSPYALDAYLHTPQVFIIDKNGALRGRDDDDEVGKLYGYNSGSVSEINGKMKDDVKVILAEYRLALKKYNDSKIKISE
ncbi:membrane protein [Aquimarina agarivorans]|uniref:membrane protein n=1 Tax=Aquimarina agarivorans TaxID=980584 RepID=UPI000248ED1F|nr:membrane protein [Aquimarina agarivorans]